MKKANRKTLKLVAATSMAIFTLLATFSASYAWFTSILKKDANADSFPVRKTESSISSISVHDFYGLTADESEFGFNPTPNHTITWSGHSGEDTVGFAMGKYSLDNPHHPVLFIFAVHGGVENLKLSTTSTYIAKNEPAHTVTVDTYANLGTYADGTIVKVLADETHAGIPTKYQCNSSEFELVWMELCSDNNPLSSVVMTHYFLFTDDPRDSTGTNQVKTGNLMVDDGTGNVTSQSKTYVPFASSSFTSANQASFVTFDNNWQPTFHDTISLFEGNTTGYTHLGIVLDYFPDSLEYISYYFLGHNLLNEGLGFVCDWEMEF